MQDYEYASYNPIAYDIANHFSEMAANYHTDHPHILDYTKYPGLFTKFNYKSIIITICQINLNITVGTVC